MKKIGGYPFPETYEESTTWKPTTRYIALSHDVLCVATTRIEGTWKAYCAAVPGQNHDREWEEVISQGCPMAVEIAQMIFPDFDEIPYSN